MLYMRTYETQQLELVNYEILDSVVEIIKKKKIISQCEALDR